jgi:16S rRNA (guanine(1405)-N(7))-methyltransferase
VNPPTSKFNVAFFFKEAHRFKKRETGVMPKFIDSIVASKIVISFPMKSMSTHNQLSLKYKETLYKYAEEHGYPLAIFKFGNEMFYIIEKRLPGGQK